MKEYKIVEKSYLEAKVLIEEAIVLMNSCGEEALSGIAREMIERDF
jgi:octaprenyl-diphosphate synthase